MDKNTPWPPYVHKTSCGHVTYDSVNGSAGTEWCATCHAYVTVVVTKK